MTKAELENKKQLGRSLYLSGMDQQEIAERLGVSRVTISNWCSREGWKEARAASVNQSDDPTLIGSLADKLSKLSAVVEKLDKKANVVDAVEVFMAFNKWLQYNSEFDPEITPDLIKAINKYQNKFLMEKMAPSAEL